MVVMELSKGESRWTPLEPLLLYFVLFFPGVYFPGETGSAETIPFSVLAELGRTLTYTLPSLALLWYLIPGAGRGEKKYFFSPDFKSLGKRDFFTFAASLPSLILIGVCVSFLVSFFSRDKGISPPPLVEAPDNIRGWIIMVISCLATGYLEESYFRYYLLTAVLPSGQRIPLLYPAKMVILSTVLFSVCHIYEGPWGVLNAALAGVFLSLLFLKFKSIHGIALAHGGYNIFVYVMGNFITH